MYMNEPYSILMKNYRECSSQRQLGAFWNSVLHRISVQAGGETKDLPKRDWLDEDGEDTYIPDKLLLKAYDLEAEMCIREIWVLYTIKLWPFKLSHLGKCDGATLKMYNSAHGYRATRTLLTGGWRF